MKVRWGYEGVQFRHTEAETPDPDCHGWQGVTEMDELIVHAANLYMMRSGAETPKGDRLWSLTNARGAPAPEDRKRVSQ